MKSLVKIAMNGFLLLTVLLFAWNGCGAEVHAEGNGTVPEIDQSRRGSIRIEKSVTDLKDGSEKPAGGVSYQVTYRTRLDGTEVRTGDKDYFREIRITDAGGVAEFTNLSLGTYLVEEVAGTPEGMEKSEAFLVSVPRLNVTEVIYDGVVYGPGGIYEYAVTAAPKSQPVLGAVRLLKVDARTGEKLQGAVFKLYQENGDAYLTESGKEVELVTDSSGSIEIFHLPYGNYFFQEQKAPDGYVLSEEKHTFGIAQSYVEGKEETLVVVQVENTPEEPETSEEPTEPTEPTKPTEPTEPTEPGNQPTPSTKPPVQITVLSPKTADGSNVTAWMGLLCISLAVFAIALIRKRRAGS